MTSEQIIRDAIAKSADHNEIVYVQVSETDTSEIHSLVMATQNCDWDYSEENRDDDEREVLDVYSTGDHWRVKVTFA